MVGVEQVGEDEQPPPSRARRRVADVAADALAEAAPLDRQQDRFDQAETVNGATPVNRKNGSVQAPTFDGDSDAAGAGPATVTHNAPSPSSSCAAVPRTVPVRVT
jgi:hypothetical protein